MLHTKISIIPYVNYTSIEKRAMYQLPSIRHCAEYSEETKTYSIWAWLLRRLEISQYQRKAGLQWPSTGLLKH